ncbi:sigma-54 dependent transcriptional regulator [soil metagenome]
MSAKNFRILIVDDEPNIRAGLAKGLASEADEAAVAKDGSEALALFRQSHHHLVITDLKMPGTVSGLDLVKQIKHERPETLILVITAHGSVETAVMAMRQGAHDYISKPVDLNILRLLVRNAREHHHLVQENRQLRDRLVAAGEFPEMIGHSAAIREVFDRIRQVADTDVTVLIRGESGTGKELVARAIHNMSARKDQPFVATNIGALPESLIESELFGYEKGAFTGAIRRKPGCFEMAQGGTLFLDEIGEMPAKTQVDLLRILEQREVRRLGGEEIIPLRARVVAATHRDLDSLVAEGSFREDLFYRLSVVPLRVPPLRERRNDIPALIQNFLTQAQERHRKEAKQLAGAAMKVLCEFPWPGNVRQLRNCMERLVVTVDGMTIHLEDLPVDLRATPVRDVVTLEQSVQEAEKAAILSALALCDQHRERTAALLNISVRTLHYKMNRYALQ